MTSAEFAAVAATVAAERRERARLESEATLLRGRLAVQETAVRVLEARRRRIADAPDAARDADPRPFPEALVAALEREYGGDMRKVVRAMLRAGAAARRPAWRPDPVEVLTQLFKRPPRPSPQVGLPFGLVMTMVPGSLPWSSELLCSIKARYLRSILLAPDCPMLSISTLLPADLERIVTSDSSRAGRGAFSPRSELERALLERGKDKWRTSCRFAARLFARFDSSQAQTSAAYVGVVDRFLVPLGRSFVSEHFDCLAGSCLCVDGESAARETGRVAGWDALRVSPAQEKQAVELYEELETLLGRVSRDAAREAHAAADAGKQVRGRVRRGGRGGGGREWGSGEDESGGGGGREGGGKRKGRAGAAREEGDGVRVRTGQDRGL